MDRIKLFIDVGEPQWVSENIILRGHYVYCIQSYRAMSANAFSKHDIFSVDRRYSDFEFIRKVFECMYPGCFIPLLPPKDPLVSFQHEDSESLQNRKKGIQQFMQGIAEHRLLANLKNKVFDDFLAIRTVHHFDDFKFSVQKTVIEPRQFVLDLKQ